MTSSRIVCFSVLFLSGACCFSATVGAQVPASAGNPHGYQFGQESPQITADRKALAEAKASGDSARILAAKEKLSDDLAALQPKPPKKDTPAQKRGAGKKPADQTTAGQSGDLIKADEKALQDALASGDLARIKAAQDKLNADQQQAKPVVPGAHNWKLIEPKRDWKYKPVTSP